jgi:hypothetical protein
MIARRSLGAPGNALGETADRDTGDHKAAED